jgi:diguanylate cyclase (GGDEF)-like protein
MPTLRVLNTETLQLAELQQQDLINTPLDAGFNRLVRLTRTALRTRIAAISLVHRDREWFKAAVGWNVTELPLERSMASTLKDLSEPLIVSDLRLDSARRSHPLVRQSPEFRFLAAYPLRDRFNHLIGFLTAYDTEPRAINRNTVEALTDLGHIAQREIFVSELNLIQQELLAKLDASRRQSLLDELTRLWNRRGGLQLLERALKGDKPYDVPWGLCVADIDRFKSINDTHGHGVGDTVLRKVACTLVDSVRQDDVVCRLGGDEFLIMVADIGVREMHVVLERLRVRVGALQIRTGDKHISPTLSMGGCISSPGAALSPDATLSRADSALYRAKRAGRNCAVLAEDPIAQIRAESA